MRGGNTIRKSLQSAAIREAAAAPLPLFSVPELDAARATRAELQRKLSHVRMDVRSRIRIEQKLNLIVAKIMRLEMQIGRQQ